MVWKFTDENFVVHFLVVKELTCRHLTHWTTRSQDDFELKLFDCTLSFLNLLAEFDQYRQIIISVGVAYVG